MFQFNYFQMICFLWAGLGIGSRIMMVIMGKKWAEWELDSAYTETKPKWIYPVGITGYLLVVYTWYQVLVQDIKLGWVIAVLVSLTTIKVTTLLFNYKTFHGFLKRVLTDKKKMFQLNTVVVIFSCLLMLMGIFVYS